MQRRYLGTGNSEKLNMAIGGMAAQRAQQQEDNPVRRIETDHSVFNVPMKLLLGLVCLICLAIFSLVYMNNLGMSQKIEQLEQLSEQQQQKLEQLKEEQQQKFDTVEEKLAETSSNFTTRLLTIFIGLLLLILMLFHLVGILKVENADDRKRAQKQLDGLSDLIDGMERDREAEEARKKQREGGCGIQ